ncbi:MAG: NAD(P)H-dependent oxidoreductase subunit E [Pseudomonadales bacterium]|nr:NAD(P)H-dependent oxidoreductase subunit E [Pseudomonadales bacterium]
MSTLSAPMLEMAYDIIAGFPAEENRLVDVLSSLQQAMGYVPPAVIPIIADRMELETPAIYKVIELTPSLSLKPAFSHKLFICNGENCTRKGSFALIKQARESLAINLFETNPRGLRLEPFRCLGNCNAAPNIMLDDEIHPHMTAEKLRSLLTDWK